MGEKAMKHLRGGYGSVYGRGNCRFSLLDAPSNFLLVFNMSATMAWQGGQVQLEQPDMRIALDMAKMAKGGFSRGTIQEMQHLIKRPRAEVG